jgi:hypothetical protein
MDWKQWMLVMVFCLKNVWDYIHNRTYVVAEHYSGACLS